MSSLLSVVVAAAACSTNDGTSAAPDGGARSSADGGSSSPTPEPPSSGGGLEDGSFGGAGDDAATGDASPIDTGDASSAADASPTVDAAPAPSDASVPPPPSDASAPIDAGTPPAMDGGPPSPPAGDAGPIDPATGARCGQKPVQTTPYGGACGAVEFYWPDEGSGHVQPPADLTYCTMPPNSGPHYPWTANYQTFTTPVPWGFLVHSIQHGGISVTYRCRQGEDCSAVAAQLQALIDAQPADPECAGTGVKNRYVLSPSPELDVAVAAAMWDWTYRANCVDTQSLQAFFNEHYGKGTEDVCEGGATSF